MISKKDKLKESIENRWHDLHKKKTNHKIVKLHEPTFGPEEIFAFTEQMISTNVTMGRKVKDFERKFSSKFSFKYGVTSNSGSSANLLMIAALSSCKKKYLEKDDEVIVPALTWSTSVFPLSQYNLVPVFVDSDLMTLNIDTNKIEEAITPKTRAIMVVHIYGNPCKMDEIVKIAKKHNLILIEDSCESMGSFYKGKAVGSFGIASSFSFYFSHHITCMEGGITVTKDFELSETMKIIRSHGWIRNVEKPKVFHKKFKDIDKKFLFVDEGYNLRITEPQAVMASKQLEKLNSFVNIRKKNAKLLKSLLNDFKSYFFFQQTTEDSEHSWFGFPITLKENVGFSRNQICDFLNKRNIETRVLVAGNLARQPALKYIKHRSKSLDVCNYIMKNSFSIGIHQGVNKESINYIYNCFKDFLKDR